MPTSSQMEVTTAKPCADRRSRTLRGRRAEDHRPSNGSLALLQALQSSLEPGVVVETFARRLGEQFGVEGLTFDHPEYARYWGDKAERPFAARLKLDGTLLGRLEFHRRRAFAPSERRELGALTELLLHPLRNALAHASLQKQAFEDGLTGLLNRQALRRMLPRELASAERLGQPLTLVMIDMDRLKPINDELGHAAGDRALQVLARAISSALRQSDLGFRIGGDEFVVLLPATPEAGAWTVVDRIIQALNEEARKTRCIGTRRRPCPAVTFSAGMATSTPGIAPEALLDAADRAMYQAKQVRRQRAGTTEPQAQHAAMPRLAAQGTARRGARR